MKSFIPNALTLCRVILVIANLLFMIQSTGVLNNNVGLYSLLGLTGMIYISDILDGKLARKWNVTTAFGEKLDVIADLFYIGMTSVVLVCQNKMPIMVLILIIIEFLVFYGSSMIKTSKPVGKVFFFDYIGRFTAGYYYVLPLIFFLISKVDRQMYQRYLTNVACLLCWVLTIIAIRNRISLVLNQRSSHRVLSPSSLQKSSHKRNAPLLDLHDLHIN